jgi:hypothetical protein
MNDTNIVSRELHEGLQPAALHPGTRSLGESRATANSVRSGYFAPGTGRASLYTVPPNNVAIVPTTTGSVSVFPSDPTHLVLDIFGFFAP